MALIERFTKNTVGSDFVAGDIHGCFDQLESAVERLAIDPVCDRLFAVGDLIDRGPLSVQALEWLEKPWFHSCLGNHEEVLLTERDPVALLSFLLFNGGTWWLEQDEAWREQFMDAISRLPLAMDIETPHGHVGIVHADVPEAMTWPEFTDALETGDPYVREYAVWSRDRAEGRVTSNVKGIERVVCGHTPMLDKAIRIVGNVWFIDTGAFLAEEGGKLTLMPLSELF